MATKRLERAAKKDNIGDAEQAVHLAERVGDVDDVAGFRRPAGAASCRAVSGRRALCCHGLAALGMTRGDDREPAIAKRRGGLDHPAILAIMCRGGKKDASAVSRPSQHRHQIIIDLASCRRQFQ